METVSKKLESMAVQKSVSMTLSDVAYVAAEAERENVSFSEVIRRAIAGYRNVHKIVKEEGRSVIISE